MDVTLKKSWYLLNYQVRLFMRKCFAIAMLVAGVSLILAGCSIPRKVTRATVLRKTTTTTQSLSATYLSPDGVVADWVVKENQLPGTTAWEITQTTGNTIAGYANLTGVQAGQSVNLYVNTTAPQYFIQAFRMGYYQGDYGRLMWTSSQLRGVNQRACPLTPGINMISCNWSLSYTFKIPNSWPQGDYLFKLNAEPGQQSYIPLTIWDPSSHATYLIDNSVFTWQAWNNWGGYDLYGGLSSTGALTYDDRSRVLSFDRPYATGNGAGDFLGNELPLIEFMEKNGLDVSYINDILFSENPNVILNHKVYLSLGHAECWDLNERNAALEGIAHGVNFVFFAASPILRHVRMQPGPHDSPDREMVDYRDPQKDPLYGINNLEVTGNTWAQPPTNLPAAQIVGDTYGGYGINDPMVIVDASAWPFQGTGLQNGSQLAGVVRFDYDHYVPANYDPPDVQILGHSPVPYPSPSYADMTYYTNLTSKAGVIATGTNFWIPSLTPCPPSQTNCPAPYLRKITANILNVFGQGPAGISHPSQTNWQQFYPSG